MLITNLDFDQDCFFFTPLTGGVNKAYLRLVKADTRSFLGGAQGSFRIVSQAIALGRSSARVTGFAEGRIVKTSTGVMSVVMSSASAIAT